MPLPEPRVVRFTDHAVAKARLLGIAMSDVEDIVLHRHSQRRRNTRAADWVTTSGLLAVAYNHPDRGDELTALVVTLWRAT